MLLDFDGTLAPLARSHDRARLPGATRTILASLRLQPRLGMAVLSGRSLPDLRSLVDLAGIYYCGNHGLEIEGPGVAFRHAGAASLRSVVQSLADRIESDLQGFTGAVLENKSLTLSLHYRGVPRRQLPPLRRLRARLQLEMSALPVRWRTGHKVWEILPEVPWHKGAASLYLMRRLRHSFPIALGDDTTDEDVFAALKGRGLSIRVGGPAASGADYYLGGQPQVIRFLRETKAALGSKR